MTGFVVREARIADIDALLDVYESIAAEARWIGGELPIDREAFRRKRSAHLASEQSLSLVAETGGRVVGELGMEVEGGRGEIGMGIASGYRRLGIGSALVTDALTWARTRMLDKVFLYVWPHNDGAIALYEKFGFAREGYHPKHFRRKSGEAWDAISMGLVL